MIRAGWTAAGRMDSPGASHLVRDRTVSAHWVQQRYPGRGDTPRVPRDQRHAVEERGCRDEAVHRRDGFREVQAAPLLGKPRGRSGGSGPGIGRPGWRASGRARAPTARRDDGATRPAAQLPNHENAREQGLVARRFGARTSPSSTLRTAAMVRNRPQQLCDAWQRAADDYWPVVGCWRSATVCAGLMWTRQRRRVTT
jgi:hypothetical protein